MRPRIDFSSRLAVSEAAAIGRVHRYWFRLFRRSVYLASDVLFDAVIQRSDKRRLMASLLLGRLSTTSQAAALLVRHGLAHDAAALVRLSFEVFVFLRACCEQDDFWHRFRDSDLMRRHKLAITGQQLSGLSGPERGRLKRSQERLEREIAERGAAGLSVEATARSMGLADDYNTVYRLTSPAVHAAPVILLDQIRSRSGEPNELEFGPSRRLVELNLHTLTDYLLRGTCCSAELFSVDRSTAWNRLYRALHKRNPAFPEGWDADDLS